MLVQVGEIGEKCEVSIIRDRVFDGLAADTGRATRLLQRILEVIRLYIERLEVVVSGMDGVRT